MMKILPLASVLLLLTACGGSNISNNNRFNNNPTPQPTAWVAGQYDPSRNFENRCAAPRSNSSYEDLAGTVTDENYWIRSWSHETYLWYSELPDINPASIASPIDYFEQLKTSATTGSGKPKDRFHYTWNTEQYKQLSESGISVGYGFTISLVPSSPPRKALIVFTEPNSPATTHNISRGAEIINIDGVSVSYGDADALNAGLFPSTTGESHSFVIRDLNASSNRTVTLQSAEITEVPVYKNQVISQGNKKIGYLVLNTFGVATAEQQLIDATNNLKSQNINELVLDLRYNGGGYLIISAELGTMIAGDSAAGKVYGEVIYNDKRSMENISYPFPSTAYGLSATAGTALPKLGLARVYILARDDTASASEYLINALRGIDVEVILIGETTHGKPYGFVPRDNCGTTYFTIQFKGANAKGFGDYADGFIPAATDNGTDQVRGCQVADDLSKALGNESENILATALYHIQQGSCPAGTTASASKPAHPLSAMRGTVIRPYPIGLILP